MNMHRFAQSSSALRTIWIAACVPIFLGPPCPAAPADRPPNFIFILTDDMGWQDLVAFGHPYLKTPHLDRFVAESTRIKQFYVANPVCSPSRTAFMTSRYPASLAMHGHLATHEQNAARGMPNWLDPATPFLTRLLHDTGYATAHFGKWHLGHGPGAPSPGEYGFDVHATYNSAGPLLGASEIEKFRRDHPDWKPKADLNEEHMPFYRAHSTRMIVDAALEFLREHRDRPSYMNLWTLLPHAPLNPTPEQRTPWVDLSPRAEAFDSWMRDYAANAKDLRSQFQVYAASMADLDTQLGRLFSGLRELGLEQNTVVIFSSDNGPEDYRIGNAANAGVGSPGPLRARKRSLYEGGIRTPFLVRWPGHVPTGRTDETSVVAAVDLLPTVCAIAGVRLPDSLKCEGVDASDILLGRPRPRRGPLFWEWRFPVAGGGDYLPPRFAAREGDWKLFTNADRSRIELYNIPRDPEERANVAAQHPQIVERLVDSVLAWGKTLPPDLTREAAKQKGGSR
jgi:arylsulfatase A-like enzyme